MKAVIYDLDGTLLDTLQDIAIACNETLKKASFSAHPLSDYRKMVGNGFETLIRRAINQPLPEEQLKLLVEKARNYYAENMRIYTLPYPGIMNILLSLQQKGFIQGVYSNKPDPLSKKLVSHYFPDISFMKTIGATPGRPLKPNPEVLLEMLENVEIAPSDTLYVGDSDVDVETAQNAGIKSVGAAWGFRGEKELKDAGADFIIHSPLELLDIVKNNL